MEMMAKEKKREMERNGVRREKQMTVLQNVANPGVSFLLLSMSFGSGVPQGVLL